ncbi:MAG TPA: hypothetical protein VG961_01850 [Ignavibacteria bacterium]|nr:hypothetical protein [Ignavibacteria bacterium]
MIKHVIKILLAVYGLNSFVISQDRLQETTETGTVNISNTSKYLLREESKSKELNSEKSGEVRSIELYRYTIDLMQKSRTIKEENTFNIVSSFRQNIRFGGFWDRYAIVNFTPDMFIKPFDFMSIYAVHNSSYFIPIKAVKEHIKLMAVQGAAILAIDNTIKHLLPASKMIKAITGFLLKNVVINSLLGQILNKGSDRIFEQGSYYCSVNIRF